MATTVELTSRDHAEALLAGDTPVLVFKHSTRCPISAGADRRVSEFQAANTDLPVTWARVLVVENRPLSMWLADTLSVRHQSPQMILMVNGQAVWDTSHGSINAEEITGALKQHGLA